MENLDFLSSQIHDSCKLALPEGLKDLMWDITREVLRAQPQNFCAFIADYLSVLLVARENISVAAHVCGDLCDNICHALLEDELKMIGFPKDKAMAAKKVIEKFFERDEVNEAKILIKLLKLMDMDQDQLLAIQNAIRTAFLRHQANRTNTFESASSDSETDDVTRAARHTFDLYRKTKPTDERLSKAAVSVQAAYRAYGVRRHKKDTEPKGTDTPKTPKRKYISVNFNELCNSVTGLKSQEKADFGSDNSDDVYVSTHPNNRFLDTASSISLAGSYLKLPKYKPYCAHESNVLHELDELAEREHTMFDYTLEQDKNSKPKRKISFHEVPQEFIDTESETSVEEMINETYEIDYDDVEEDIANENNVKDDHTIESSGNTKYSEISEVQESSKNYKTDGEGNENDKTYNIEVKGVDSSGNEKINNEHEEKDKIGEETYEKDAEVDEIYVKGNDDTLVEEDIADDEYIEMTGVKHVTSEADIEINDQ